MGNFMKLLPVKMKFFHFYGKMKILFSVYKVYEGFATSHEFIYFTKTHIDYLDLETTIFCPAGLLPLVSLCPYATVAEFERMEAASIGFDWKYKKRCSQGDKSYQWTYSNI